MVKVIKITCHLVSRSKSGKRAEIIVLEHLSNGKFKSHTCHAAWDGQLWQAPRVGASIPEDKLINGMPLRRAA